MAEKGRSYTLLVKLAGSSSTDTSFNREKILLEKDELKKLWIEPI